MKTIREVLEWVHESGRQVSVCVAGVLPRWLYDFLSEPVSVDEAVVDGEHVVLGEFNGIRQVWVRLDDITALEVGPAPGETP